MGASRGSKHPRIQQTPGARADELTGRDAAEGYINGQETGFLMAGRRTVNDPLRRGATKKFKIGACMFGTTVIDTRRPDDDMPVGPA
jgi:hypothetical protein